MLNSSRCRCSPLRGLARAAALFRAAASAALLVLAGGCATQPGPLQLMQAGPQAAANRELQTRPFRDVSESELLAACVGVLQDLSFRIKASDAQLGVIVGTKPRPLEDIVADIGRLSLVVGATFGLQPHPEAAMGPSSAFGVVLATRPGGAQAGDYSVRVTFFRMWTGVGPGSLSADTTRGAMVINSPGLYQQFFGMLGAALARSRPSN